MLRGVGRRSPKGNVYTNIQVYKYTSIQVEMKTKKEKTVMTRIPKSLKNKLKLEAIKRGITLLELIIEKLKYE